MVSKIGGGRKYLLCICAGQTVAGEGADPAGHSLAAAAAEQNDPCAQYRLGKLLLTGAEGVPKDIDAAIQLLKGSAIQGNSFAQYTLGKLYLLGQEVQVDREEALRYFAQAAEQGNTYAQYYIDHQEDFSGAAVGTAILRMLHQMSRIFRENAAQPAIYAGRSTRSVAADCRRSAWQWGTRRMTTRIAD